MKLFLIFVFILAVAYSCTSPNSPAINPPGGISYSNLRTGQESRYVKFTGYGYFWSDSIRYEYNKDTVVVEIAGEKNGVFLVKERYTFFSETLMKIRRKELPLDSTSSYSAIVRNDSIFFFGSDGEFFYSILFDFVVGEIKLDLKNISENKTQPNGWKTKLPYCECFQQGYMDDFELLGNYYGRVNVVVNDEQMQTDGPGKTYIYSAAKGMIKTYIVNWWTQNASGWALLPR